MLKEHLAILFSCYLLANLYLIPIFAVNLSGLLNLFGIAWQVRIHKYAVVLALACPLFIYVYSEPFQAMTVRPDSISMTVARSDVAVSDDSPNIPPFEAISESRRLLPGDAKSIIIDGIYFLIEYFLLMTLTGGIYFCFRLCSQWYVIRKLENHVVRKKSFRHMDIFISSRITLPFSVGVFRRKVYLPDIYTPVERQIIINHEFNHFRKNHHVWSLLESLLHYLFWYNPISFYLRVKGMQLREIECDAITLLKTDVYLYSRLLIKTAESHRRNNSSFMIAQNLISRQTLKKRIAHMMNKPVSKKTIGVSALVAVAMIISISALLLYGTMNDQQAQSEILSHVTNRYAKTLSGGKVVEIEKVPQHFIEALLVKEDRDFFKHDGIKLYNSVKAAVYNLFQDREYWLGASTITQQLAKQFLDGPNDKTWGRKFRELKIAKVLEKNFTKFEILEMYLNSVYFGNDAWGLNQATEKFFGHSYEELTLKESALLVPSLVAPAKYNAKKNPQLARARQEKLLRTMLNLGILSRIPEE